MRASEGETEAPVALPGEVVKCHRKLQSRREGMSEDHRLLWQVQHHSDQDLTEHVGSICKMATESPLAPLCNSTMR